MHCSRCGTPLGPLGHFCAKCGLRRPAAAPRPAPAVATAPAGLSPVHAPPPAAPAPVPPARLPASAPAPAYAGNGLRLAAATIDFLIVKLAAEILADSGRYDVVTLLFFDGDSLLVTLLFAGVYSVLLESSTWQATVGKKLMGLRVVDASGARPGLGTAALRYLGKALTWKIFSLAFLAVPLSRTRQALHDRLAGTLVVRA